MPWPECLDRLELDAVLAEYGSLVFIIIIVFVLALIYGPNLWVMYVLNKYSKADDSIPGTGGELAVHLLRKFELQAVKVELADKGVCHYSPGEKIIRLEPRVFEGKSLTAVASAAHEVGHAIQFNRNEAVTLMRNKCMPTAVMLKKCGLCVLMAMPIIGLLTKSPHLTAFTLTVGFMTLFASVLMYVAILPEEYDASFNKALPILERGEYISAPQIPAVRRILRACALTYLASALLNIFSVWRLLRVIR